VGELRLSSERQARRAWLDSKRSRDSAEQMTGRQAQMSEDLSDHCGLFDSGDDFQFTPAVRAVFDVDIEYPITKTIPWFSPFGPACAVQNPLPAVLSAVGPS